MKLYHGTNVDLNVGDMLRTDKSECVGINISLPAVYATSYFQMAMDYTIAPMNHQWMRRDINYLPFANIVLARGEHTCKYVYRVDDTGFSKLADYADTAGDEWVSTRDVKILEKIELTPQLMAQNGYDVHVARGANKLMRTINYKLARVALSYKMHSHNRGRFDKVLNKLTVKVDGK